MERSDTDVVGRVVTLSLTAIVGIAFVGYFVGLRQKAPTAIESKPAQRSAAGDAIPARSYAEVRANPLGPNAAFRSSLDALRPSTTPAPTRVTPASEEEKRVAMQERERLRAYDGAPPTIPHAVDQMTSEACLLCHENGKQIGDQVARPMPHGHLAVCTQCHVPDLTDRAPTVLSEGNSFAALPASNEGRRAWEGAPPVIPHATNMRENCLACHGGLGRDAIRTTHPWRQSCQQCHAPSADLNQQPRAAGRSFLSQEQ